MLQMNAFSRQNHIVYTTAGDFCRIFAEDMNALYLLGLLLTAEPANAESCFVSGLADCVDGQPVFKEWGRSWARRAIVKNAIRLMGPKPGYRGWPSMRSARHLAGDEKWDWESGLYLNSLLQLDVFDRFVFVMVVLEKYSEHECSLLLGCSRRDVILARNRAFGHMGDKVGPQSDEFLQPVEAA
ncbi:MAG: hypothetical protein JOZ14_10615 [Acidobacteria bacterium]|nr:hypothetical protein [Acidobacteriota bacterium]